MTYNVLRIWGGRMTIKTFKDLDAWKVGHEFVLEIYRLTKGFPREEIFGLTSQLRRCAVSITSNIAEGFSRRTYREKIQFYSMALGSVTEAQNQITVAKDIGYLEKTGYDFLEETTVRLHKLLNGLIKSASSRNT